MYTLIYNTYSDSYLNKCDNNMKYAEFSNKDELISFINTYKDTYGYSINVISIFKD